MIARVHLLDLSVTKPLLGLLLLLGQGMVDVLVVDKEHWSLLEHLGHDQVPVGPPPVLLYFHKIVGDHLIDVFEWSLLTSFDGWEALLVRVEMSLELLHQTIVVPLVQQVCQ